MFAILVAETDLYGGRQTAQGVNAALAAIWLLVAGGELSFHREPLRDKYLAGRNRVQGRLRPRDSVLYEAKGLGRVRRSLQSVGKRRGNRIVQLSRQKCTAASGVASRTKRDQASFPNAHAH